ncbi:MAG TPA: SPFH domain-containing protein, partial [Vicinamibacterales bacterium]|nr:SPFH domain-containing protein [Vicinamibacterales bacterium]
KDGRVLARRVECNSFQDARAFLEGGGERGPQITVIPPGTYRINTALFTVQGVKVLDIPDNMVGIVTTKEGRPLAAGEIASQPVAGHNSFQDAQAFVDAGGGKGLQEQVILAGRYFINPRFATVEIKETTIVPIANVGVVIAYIGKEGKDVTGDAFKHGNLVNKGEKGVWVEPLDPGKYPINPYTHRVEVVPTANVVLNWATGKTEAHNLDKNLSTITVRSSDGFTFNLDVSQIIHIPRSEAPKVIARFGSMVNLVTQVLEPTIGNYFRNAAQGSDVIDFLRTRRERQEDARRQIQTALSDYNVVAVDTLIGDITPPDALMTTLTDRKLAEQEKVTYDTQRLAEETRKELQQATAMADTQASVVAAERQVQIQAFQASAAVKTAEGQAASRKLVADGEAYATRATGNADAEKTKAVGTAEADVIKLKIASMDSGNYAGIEISKALASSGFKLVPDVVVSGGSGGTADGGNSLVSVLLANLIRDGRLKRSE